MPCGWAPYWCLVASFCVCVRLSCILLFLCCVVSGLICVSACCICLAVGRPSWCLVVAPLLVLGCPPSWLVSFSAASPSARRIAVCTCNLERGGGGNKRRCWLPAPSPSTFGGGGQPADFLHPHPQGCRPRGPNAHAQKRTNICLAFFWCGPAPRGAYFGSLQMWF